MTLHIKYRAAGLLAALENNEVRAGPRVSFDALSDKDSKQTKVR